MSVRVHFVNICTVIIDFDLDLHEICEFGLMGDWVDSTNLYYY